MYKCGLGGQVDMKMYHAQDILSHDGRTFHWTNESTAYRGPLMNIYPGFV